MRPFAVTSKRAKKENLTISIQAFKLFGTVELKGDKVVVSDLKKVSHQVDATRKGFDGLSRSFKSGLTLGGNALSTFSSISNVIQGIPVVGRLLDGAMSFATGPIKDMAQLGLSFNDVRENATLAFGVILKDGNKALSLVKQIEKFGKDSPIFKTGELIPAVQRFLPILGPGPELFDAIKGIGAAAAAGNSLDRLPDIFRSFASIARKPKASAEEFSQELSEAGIDAYGLLARGRGQSVGEVMDLIGKGRISGIGAFKVITAQALREYGSLVDLMGQTRTGKQAQIDDTLEQLAARGTQNLHGAWKGAQDRLLGQLQGPKGGQLADQINDFSGFYGEKVLGAFDSLTDGSLLGKMQKAGEDVKKGISQGFDGVKTGVGNAVEYVTGFKAGIGSNSPAKEFIPLGQYAAQGFLIGFDAEMIAAGAPMSLFQKLGGKETQGQRRAENEKLLQHPAIQAMMDAIGVGEGTFDPKTGKRNYAAWFGNAKFNPTAEHPGVSPVPFFNKKTGKWDRSSAAGFGQFLRGTWAGVEDDIGNLDFNNAHDQELAFVEKMRDRGMISAILSGDIRKAMALGAPEWASLPGSPHKQPTVKEATVLDTFEKRLGFYANGQPITASNPMPVTMSPSAPSVSGGEILGGKVPLTAEQMIKDYNTALATAKGIQAQQEFLRQGMLKNGKTPEEVDKLLAATDKGSKATENAAKVTEEKAIPSLQKLGESARLTAEQMAKNRKLSDLEGADADKANKAKRFDAVLNWEGVAGDFGNGLQGLMANLGWDKTGSLGKEALFNFIRDAQGRLAHDFSAMITGSLFGFAKGGEGDDAGKLQGGLLSKIFGGLFGGFRATGGPVSAGRFYVAGEHGRELFVPQTSGHIYNHRETQQMMQGGGNTQVLFALGDRAIADMNDQWASSRRGTRRLIRVNARYGRAFQI